MAGARPDREIVRQLGRACTVETERFLRIQLAGLFKQINEVLVERAKMKSADNLETSYFDAIQAVRRYREMISDAFVALVDESIAKFWAHAADPSAEVPPAKDQGGLSLMMDDDLEENIAIGNVVSRIEKTSARELKLLNRRLGLLAGSTQFTNSVNPVGPQSITQAFSEALELLHGEMPVKLIIYKLFDKQMTAHLGKLYNRLNDQLIAASVLPNLEADEDAGRQAEDPGSAAAPSVAVTDAGLKLSDEATIFGLVTVLRTLLDSQRDGLGLLNVPAGDKSALREVNVVELLGSLEGMQQRFASAMAANVESAIQSNAQFKMSFVEYLSGEGQEPGKQLQKPDQHIVDVVMMLFDFVLDDPIMPDAMKVILSRLQIPVLRAAISDRSFLSNKNHPARSLLNNLARTGIHWTDDGDRSAHSIYGRVETAVNRVLAEFSDDIAVFAAIDLEFQTAISRETSSAGTAEQRLAQLARGAEQLGIARDRVTELLDTSINEQLPVAAYNILNEGWKDVLTLVLLREGESSRAWQKAFGVVQRLADSVIPRTEEWQRQKTMRDIPLLIADLREGFASVSYDPKKSTKLFKQLQLCHINALRGQGVRTIAEEFRDHFSDRGHETGSELLQDQYYDLALAVETGKWLSWRDADGRELRGKLSWRSEITDLLLMVDAKGKKVAEMTNYDLAALFRNDKVRVLEHIDMPLLDRALNAVLSNLRNATRAGGSVLPA